MWIWSERKKWNKIKTNTRKEFSKRRRKGKKEDKKSIGRRRKSVFSTKKNIQHERAKKSCGDGSERRMDWKKGFLTRIWMNEVFISGLDMNANDKEGLRWKLSYIIGFSFPSPPHPLPTHICLRRRHLLFWTEHANRRAREQVWLDGNHQSGRIQFPFMAAQFPRHLTYQ